MNKFYFSLINIELKKSCRKKKIKDNDDDGEENFVVEC